MTPKVKRGWTGAIAGLSEASGGDLQGGLLRAIDSQDLTIDGVDRRKRRTRLLSSFVGERDGKNVTKVRKLLALRRTLKVLLLLPPLVVLLLW